MITKYNRPKTIEEALTLLSRPNIKSVLAGGGTTLHRLTGDPVEVIDLQAIELNQIQHQGNWISLGATLTLQKLSEIDMLPSGLQTAAMRETSFNLRQAGTLAGTLVACDGCSPFTACMLALDAQLTLISGSDRAIETIALGELLPMRDSMLKNRLITQVTIPANVQLDFEMVGRTPADWPLCGVVVGRWPSGRTRITLMGFGALPILAMDGPEPGGAIDAVKFAFSTANDEWATAEYRQAVAAIQVERILSRLDI